ncbi:MAG: hypothetical protein ACI32E_02835 [Bacilli bacterium]
MKQKSLFIIIIIIFGLLVGCTLKDDTTIVDKPINDFLTNYAQDYLSNSNREIDYNVVRGIKLLEQVDEKVKLTDYLTIEDAKKYIDSLDYSYSTQFFKAAVIDKCFNMKSDKPMELLAKVEEVDIYSTSYVYYALDYYDVNPTLKAQLLGSLNIIKAEDYRDADYAGICLCVTINEQIDKTPFLDLIKDSVSSGGISTWGQVNASSTAVSIMGLLSEGIDLEQNYLDEEGNTLINNLLTFEQEGAFKWVKDGPIDLDFSTPQSFLACVCYKVYLKNHKPVVVF